jgi:hypothetical protein
MSEHNFSATEMKVFIQVGNSHSISQVQQTDVNSKKDTYRNSRYKGCIIRWQHIL